MGGRKPSKTLQAQVEGEFQPQSHHFEAGRQQACLSLTRSLSLSSPVHESGTREQGPLLAKLSESDHRPHA